MEKSLFTIETINKGSLKSSQEKNVKKQILENIPNIADIFDKLWPKKATVLIGKQKPYTTIYFINDEPLFIQVEENPIVPHIRLIHKYPFLLPTCQVDKGAIPFVIGGANIMCPGLTSKGGIVPEGKVGTAVAIMCEGMKHCLGIGIIKMTPQEIKRINKGIALELISYIGDNVWNCK